MMRPVLKRGTSAGKLRPLSVPKIAHLSDRVPTSRIDDSLSSPINLSSHYGNDSGRTTTHCISSCLSPTSNATNGANPFSLFHSDPNSSSSNPKNHRNRNDPKLNWMDLPPQTNWNIFDNNLKPIPPYYPPLISSNCTYIFDASTSIVAARIVQCLMRRNLTAEFDNNETRATVFGGGMTSFGIRLYRGNKRGPARRIPLTLGDGGAMSPSTKNTPHIVVRSDFPHGIIVECARIRGDVIAFHRDCQAVLASARGEIDSVDECRRPFGVLLTKGQEEEKFCKLPLPPPQSSSLLLPPAASVSSLGNMKTLGQPSGVARSVCTALETSLSLLEKDRICAQLLGMQSIVFLTDLKSSRLDKAYLSSLCVLGSPINYTDSLNMNYSSSLDYDDVRDMGGNEEREEDVSSISTITSIHNRILRFIMQPRVDMHNDNFGDSSSSRDQDTTILSNSSSVSSSAPTQVDHEHHISMRRMAIQAFTNALSIIVSNSDSFPLLPPLHCATLHQEEFIYNLTLDLAEAARPHIAMLACPHDTALATRLLCLIVRYYNSYTNLDSISRHKSCSDEKIGDMGLPTKKVWDLLEGAKIEGMSCYNDLEVERVFNDLTISRDCGRHVDME